MFTETESKIQQDCFIWFWNEFPILRRTLFHIPNGGVRGRVAGNRMKSIGVVAGVPDFCFLHEGRAFFIELKTDTGIISGKQKEIHFIFAKQGFDVNVVRTLDEFKNLINKIVGSEKKDEVKDEGKDEPKDEKKEDDKK